MHRRILLTLLATASGISAAQAQQHTVRISVVLVRPKLHDVADVCGSGWTARIFQAPTFRGSWSAPSKAW